MYCIGLSAISGKNDRIIEIKHQDEIRSVDSVHGLRCLHQEQNRTETLLTCTTFVHR